MPTILSDSHGTPHAVAYTFQIRGGVERDRYGKKAGKGPLVKKEHSACVAVVRDIFLWQENEK